MVTENEMVEQMEQLLRGMATPKALAVELEMVETDMVLLAKAEQDAKKRIDWLFAIGSVRSAYNSIRSITGKWQEYHKDANVDAVSQEMYGISSKELVAQYANYK